MHFHEIVIKKKIDISKEMNNICDVFFTEEHLSGSLYGRNSIATIID